MLLVKKFRMTFHNSAILCEKEVTEWACLPEGKDTGMIKSQSEHHSSEDNHNDRPGIEYRIFGRTFVFIFQETGQINQQTCTDNLGYVIKSTLPTYILSLFLCIQLVHIYPVTGHIVRCPAKGDNGEQGDSDCKKDGR